MSLIRKHLRTCMALLLCAVLVLITLQGQSAVSWGDRGDTVRRAQERLKQYGYYSGSVDGIYGQKTYDAVIWFQKNNNLRQDGVIGPATAAALGISLHESAQASSGTESEIYTLARLVHGEARGEPYIGKVAVAAVVLNRVRSAQFPNTISGVIFQSGAFDAVRDGQIWLTPDSDSIRAAHDALNGWDPTYGCIYYYNPATATNAWIWTREVRLTIGAHAFAV
ncbi:MAG: spore cortex-lytic enzyme [Clostridiales bacterium]|nr:spore cortex-lytic enzyme [Clostridiales bacterium]